MLKNHFDPNNEKITDRAFLHSFIVSIISILICIVALCSLTYAWFSAGVSSAGSSIAGSRFALDIKVVNNADDSDVVLTENDKGAFTCTLAEGEYTVTLKMTDDTTASKGFCDIKIDLNEVFHTSPVSKDETIGHDPLSFTVKIVGESVSVTFVPKWGISSTDVPVENGDTITVGTQPSTHEVE